MRKHLFGSVGEMVKGELYEKKNQSLIDLKTLSTRFERLSSKLLTTYLDAGTWRD